MPLAQAGLLVKFAHLKAAPGLVGALCFSVAEKSCPLMYAL